MGVGVTLSPALPPLHHACHGTLYTRRRTNRSEMERGFKVQSKVKSFLVQCATDAEADSWVAAIQAEISALAKQTKRKCTAWGVGVCCLPLCRHLNCVSRACRVGDATACTRSLGAGSVGSGGGWRQRVAQRSGRDRRGR